MELPELVVYVVIEPKTKEDQEKFGQGLQKLMTEDPTFRVNTDTTDRTELLILISPYVVRSREEAREVTGEFADRLQGLKRMGEALRARHERFKAKREKAREDAGGGPAAPSP